MHPTKKLALLALFLGFSQPTSAQESTPEATEHSEKRNIWSLTSENDKYGTRGSDRNYTNGLRLSMMKPVDLPPELMQFLADHTPFFRYRDETYMLYSFGQNIFTPQDITVAEPQPNERPWAGYTYGSAALVSGSRKMVDILEASVGVVGPSSLAEQTQREYHRLIHADMPRGWDNQLKDEPALMLSWERRWLNDKRFRDLPSSLGASPYLNLTVGNVYTYAATGISLRYNFDGSSIQDEPLRVRPGLGGTTYYQDAKPFDFYLFGGIETRFMARNIFLDGNTFKSSPSVDKKTVVADFQIGVAATFDKWRISYSLIRRTKEFKGQDKDDIFGAISLSTKF